LILARNPATGETKYFVSNAAANTPLTEMLQVAFARWHVEMWFRRAKQETGFGAFEVRTYTSLIRHWLSSRMAMYFLAAETQRLRGGKSADHGVPGNVHARWGEAPRSRFTEAGCKPPWSGGG
jgi:SRSO17 transposase